MPPVLMLRNVLKGFDFAQCRASEASPLSPSRAFRVPLSSRLFSFLPSSSESDCVYGLACAVSTSKTKTSCRRLPTNATALILPPNSNLHSCPPACVHCESSRKHVNVRSARTRTNSITIKHFLTLYMASLCLRLSRGCYPSPVYARACFYST
jgi:hypothetical protein